MAYIYSFLDGEPYYPGHKKFRRLSSAGNSKRESCNAILKVLSGGPNHEFREVAGPFEWRIHRVFRRQIQRKKVRTAHALRNLFHLLVKHLKANLASMLVRRAEYEADKSQVSFAKQSIRGITEVIHLTVVALN